MLRVMEGRRGRWFVLALLEVNRQGGTVKALQLSEVQGL